VLRLGGLLFVAEKIHKKKRKNKGEGEEG